MGYKDKEKQKEANRLASQRRRDKQKGMTQPGMTRGYDGLTAAVKVYPNGETESVPAEDFYKPPIENFGESDCQCKHCQQNRTQGYKHRINHGPYKTWQELKNNELNRVALPGDADYDYSWMKPEMRSKVRTDSVKTSHINTDSQTKVNV